MSRLRSAPLLLAGLLLVAGGFAAGRISAGDPSGLDVAPFPSNQHAEKPTPPPALPADRDGIILVEITPEAKLVLEGSSVTERAGSINLLLRNFHMGGIRLQIAELREGEAPRTRYNLELLANTTSSGTVELAAGDYVLGITRLEGGAASTLRLIVEEAALP